MKKVIFVCPSLRLGEGPTIFARNQNPLPPDQDLFSPRNADCLGQILIFDLNLHYGATKGPSPLLSGPVLTPVARGTMSGGGGRGAMSQARRSIERRLIFSETLVGFGPNLRPLSGNQQSYPADLWDSFSH